MSINPFLLIHLLANFDSDKKNFGIVNDIIFNDLLFFLSHFNIKIINNTIDQSIHNKLSIALIAIQNGVDMFSVCSKINWHDFELFSSELLRIHGYTVCTNFRIKNPKREIDVIGMKNGNALMIDCKHWKNKSITGLRNIIEKQKNRAVLFVQKSRINIESAFPIVLTLLPNYHEIVDDVPIISIDKLNSFLLDFDSINHNFYSI